MLTNVRSFFVDLHEDETGPTTVEWILLVVVGLIILAAIFIFARYLGQRTEDVQGDVESTEDETGIAE